MKVVILAAGQGTRLGSLTKNKPKCLVELNGKTILQYQLDLFSNEGKINKVIVVCGYKQKKIINKNIIKVHNKNFLSTNMVSSLFCAKDFFDDDLIISYGDIIYSKSILEKLISSDEIFSVAVDLEWKKLWSIRMDNPVHDVESMIIKNKKIVELGNKVNDLNQVEGQYIGLIKIKKDFISEMLEFYNSLNKNKKYRNNSFDNMYMTTFIQLIINRYNIVTPILINSGWLEIDTVSDLEKYEKLNYINNIVPI